MAHAGLQCAMLIAALAAATPLHAQPALSPSSAFVQAGVGDRHTQAYTVGATWDWGWHARLGPAAFSGYVEAAFGRWTTHDHGVSSAWPTQISATPVLRISPLGAASRWFGELGVGLNYIVPLFRSGQERFSTEFNFGDHLAIGRQFGSRRQTEVALRLEHFSNAGIQHPNPGENFVQLRVAYRFR